MADLTPAEELCAAAKVLRETAEKAPKGPWQFVPDLYWDRSAIMSDCPDLLGWDRLVMDVHSDSEHPAAEWAALASPVLAEPLAARLEKAAREADMNEHRAPRHRVDLDADLAVARAINGSTS